MFTNVWNEIRRGKTSSLYLLYGEESFLIDYTKNLLVDLLPEEEQEFNLSIYDLEDTPVEAAVEDCRTIPFFGDKKIVILYNPYFLTAEKGKEKVEHNIKVFEEYLQSPVPHTILVIIAPYEKLDARKKLTKFLLKNAVALEAKFSEKETKKWIKDYTGQYGLRITDGAVDLIHHLAGPDLAVIHNEIEKLSLYAEVGVIDEAKVQQLVPKSLENNVFVLVDKVVGGKLDEALEIYYDLLKLNEEPVKLLALIASQIRLLYQVKLLARQGYGEGKIAGILKVHPYRVKLAARHAKNIPEEKLLEMIGMLAELDFKMKSGYGKREKLLELFFFRFLK